MVKGALQQLNTVEPLFIKIAQGGAYGSHQVPEESPTDDEIDNYDSIISRGAERAEKVQLSLRR